MRKYTILQELLPKFESKMESFAKKFSKYGQGSYTYVKGTPYICEDKANDKYGMWLVDINIDAIYKINDYTFIASLEWIEDAKENLIKKISNNIYVPEEYKYKKECDHCKTKRQRKYTVLLLNTKSNEYVQVGKSCLKDYLGVDIGDYAKYISFFDDLDEYLLSCDITKINNKRNYNVNDIIALTLENVKRYGYISKQQSLDNNIDSTAYRVFMILTTSENDNRIDNYIKYKDIDISEDQIQEVKDFYLNLESSNNDYINNIKTILKTDWVSLNNIALVVSSIGTKLRIEREKKEIKEENFNSKHIGNIGDKNTFRSKIECIYSTMSPYGMFRIYKMFQGENEIIWKTTKYIDPDIEYNITATVKGHEEYKGHKQTEITRAKIKII